MKKSNRVVPLPEIIGKPVMNSDTETVGRIEDVRLDVQEGLIDYVVLYFGGSEDSDEKYFLLPWGSLDWDDERKILTVDVDSRQLRNCPGIPKERWPDRPILEEYGRYLRGHPLRQIFWK